jgi:protein gp37
MGTKTGIEWTDATWNPVTGCTRVTRGCDHCYAATFAQRRLRHVYTRRLPAVDTPSNRTDPFAVRLWPERLDHPLTWTEPRMIFVNSIWEGHRALLGLRKIPGHIWLGTSVEDDDVTYRVRHLKSVNAATRFLSCEPLLGPLPSLDLHGIHWVIGGGESGTGARPVDPSWALQLRDTCVRQKVPFFWKQWGGRTPKSGGRLLDGEEWSQYPTVAQAHCA